MAIFHSDLATKTKFAFQYNICQSKRCFFLYIFKVKHNSSFQAEWNTPNDLYVCSVWFAMKFLFWTKFSPRPLILQFGWWTEKIHSSHNFIMILQMRNWSPEKSYEFLKPAQKACGKARNWINSARPMLTPSCLDHPFCPCQHVCSILFSCNRWIKHMN